MCDGSYPFVFLDINEIDYRFSFCCQSGIGYCMDFDFMDLARVGKKEDVGVC